MTLNMGQTDRIVRAIIGVALLAGAVFFFGSNVVLAVILGVLALVMFVTATLSFCPLYLPFRISTRKQPQQ